VGGIPGGEIQGRLGAGGAGEWRGGFGGTSNQGAGVFTKLFPEKNPNLNFHWTFFIFKSQK